MMKAARFSYVTPNDNLFNKFLSEEPMGKMAPILVQDIDLSETDSVNLKVTFQQPLPLKHAVSADKDSQVLSCEQSKSTACSSYQVSAFCMVGAFSSLNFRNTCALPVPSLSPTQPPP